MPAPARASRRTLSRWIPLAAATVYLALFASYIYLGQPSSDLVLFLAPLAFGFVARRWWAVAVPLLVLPPVPVVLAFFPPDGTSEDTPLGLAFLIAFWAAINCALVAVGVALGRARRWAAEPAAR